MSIKEEVYRFTTDSFTLELARTGRAKRSRVTRQSYLAVNFVPSEIEEAVEFAVRGGRKALYLPPWIWASGQGSSTPGLESWATTLGHFGVNRDAFPNGEKDLRALSDLAGARGVTIGAHTISAWISPDDSYVTPKPHPNVFSIQCLISSLTRLNPASISSSVPLNSTGFSKPLWRYLLPPGKKGHVSFA